MAAPAVAEVARGSLGAAAARRSPLVSVALDGEQAWARARAWAERAVPDAEVVAVRVGSVRYRPDGSCTLRYLVQLAPGRREQILLVEVPRSATDIVVRPFPDDPALPTLRRALDPVGMREVLGRILPGTGGERGVGRCAVDVVRYPRQGRCVLRYRLTPGAGRPGGLPHPVVFGKVHADGTAAAAASALRLLRAGLPLPPDHLRINVPRPLAVVPSLRLGLVGAVPGRPLLPELLKASGDPGAADSRALSAAVRTAAGMVAAVHAVRPRGTVLPARDLPGERAAVEHELALLEPVWPETAGRLRRGVARALDDLGDPGRPSGWPSAPVLAHGDWTPGQVLLDDSGRAGLVDVDTLCLAEPALDLGRFLAYLHVAGIRRSPAAWPLLDELSAVFLQSYLDAGTPSGATADTRRVLLARTAAHRALALARLGASACWQLKDDRLAAVVDVVDAGNEWTRGVRG